MERLDRLFRLADRIRDVLSVAGYLRFPEQSVPVLRSRLLKVNHAITGIQQCYCDNKQQCAPCKLGISGRA